MNRLKALWAHLVTKEKVLLKSATIWLSAIIAAAPDLLSFAQANFPSVAQYLPHALQDPVMRFIGLAVFIARMRSLVKLPPATPLPPPAPGTVSSSDTLVRVLLVAALVGTLASAAIAVATEVPEERNRPIVEGHPLTSIVITQCNLIVAVYTTMPDGRLLRFDKAGHLPVDSLLQMAYSATRSERVEVSCNEVGAVGFEQHGPI